MLRRARGFSRQTATSAYRPICRPCVSVRRMSDFADFRVAPGARVKLSDVAPPYKGRHPDHPSAAAERQHYTERRRALQELL